MASEQRTAAERKEDHERLVSRASVDVLRARLDEAEALLRRLVAMWESDENWTEPDWIPLVAEARAWVAKGGRT